MSNLQPNCCLKFDFQKVDQHAGGKWLIHDTKRRKDNQLQSLKLPYIWGVSIILWYYKESTIYWERSLSLNCHKVVFNIISYTYTIPGLKENMSILYK